ncbi:S8 family serine peptidase [Prevotella sp. Sow4_E9_plate]|uniref:S8 family serine peptidase n=1 Tax=Prevotella sp. Sow4_E9_plate TaxID=3438802 RepID=UPI003F9A054F
MTRRLLLLVCAVLCLGSNVRISAQSTSSTTQSAESNFVEGVVRVKLQREIADRMIAAKLPLSVKGTNKKYVQTGVTPLDRVNQKVKAVSMTRVFPYAGKDEAKHKAAGLDLWYDVHYEASGMKLAQARNLFRSAEGVSYAQRIPLYKPIGGERFLEISPAAVAKAAKAASTMPFNDPLLNDQWHYNNDGHIAGTKVGADANVFKAWETGVTGSKDVVVAIIDGGFQVDHPDLKDNVWINTAELNGKPGVDDDGDGYVDDIYGYNFVINSSDINAHSHGTHVAGTVGATNNNGIGVCGVAGGSDGKGGVKMMVCQVFDSRASSSAVADFGAAIVYAADRGASIAQCSWGAGVADEEDKSVTEAVDYFTKNGGGDKMNGGLCIFASGNNGEEGNYYPGCLDKVVAVGSMAPDGSVAYYSNRGKWVDVTAPGGLEDNGQQYGVLSTLPNSTYGYNEGTSMACPHVSGIAALILSKYGNKQFSNETLRTLLTTSVNDLYTQNPEYEGLMGSGYIDAYKALQGKEGSVPEAVADFTVTASHDNALIEWTIPETEEKSIDHHVIYYSTEAFSATDDLNKLSSATVDTKFKYSGDKMSYEVEGLKASTKYYFAIVAYNRWGKASAVSPIKEATTNSGPKVQVDQKNLSMTVDATKASTAEASFNVKNAGEGVLKYQLTTATTRATMSTSGRVKNPNPGQVLPFSGTVSPTLVKRKAVATSNYQAKDWPDTLTYSNQLYSYIGETDTKLPNALAQYFYVDKATYPNGFNLTDLHFQGQNGQNPVIEIYDGSRTISTASLIQKVNYDFWAYNYPITLKEQIHFAPGSSFWVVAKFPAGAKNPLGTGKTTRTDVAQYSFYSSDNGTTWTQLSEVLKGTSFEAVANQLTWAVQAISKNPDWSQVLNPEPISGEVRPNESQKVTLKNDGQKLVNGTYKFNIHVKSNEAVDSKQQVALAMTVKGYKPELHSQQLVDFGDLLVGQTKTIDVELTNSGYGVFAGKYGMLQASQNEVKSSSDQFNVSKGAKNIAARSTGTLPVTFAPTKEGNFSSTITLTDKNGNQHSFLVRGVASVPAKQTVTPDVYEAGDLKVGGEDKTATITIKNTGNYPLQYVFPKFSSEKIVGSTAKVHKFGYTTISNVAGDESFKYEAAPELADEKDITSQFTNNNWQSGPIKVGFKFPFYGKDYDEIYVSSYGGVSMQQMDGRISCMVPTGDCVQGLGYISAYTNSGWMDMGANSKITYGHKNGKFYVKFKDVVTPATNGGGETTTISFHMALCPDGSVEVYYDDYNPAGVFGSGGHNFVGVSDIAASDPCIFVDANKVQEDNDGLNAPYYDIQTGSAIKIVAPAKSMIKSLSSTDGYVGNGESKEIKVTLAANDDLVAGPLTNYLTVITNDPINPSASVKLTANIVGDNLKAEAALDSTSVDFGKVFRTSAQQRTVLLSNNGKDVLNVTSVSVKNGKFTLAEEMKAAFSVPAGQGKDIVVTLPTAEKGTVEDVLVITYQDGTTKEIPLKAEVIGNPTWKSNPESLKVETPYGTNVEKTIQVTNEGDENLTFSAEPASWYTASDLEANGNSTVDYVFKSKLDGFDVPYNWVDITNDYTEHMPYAYYINKTDFKKVELPFEFPFYGKKYKSMYIYNTGFVSFDAPVEDYKQFPEPPASLPTTETFYTNIICPFWGNHSMNTPSSDGVYYKAKDDEVIVSYKNYGNTMMLGMNFEVILRKDGSFKFQYHVDPDGFQLGVFGLCGIMDHTGTRGITPADMYITDGNTVEFTPYKNYVVAPGEQVEMPVELKADQLADTYDCELNVTTNDPSRASVKIPVTLNITGEAQAEFPEVINVEQPVDEYAMNPSYYEFYVVNKGTKAFTITNVASEMFVAADPDDPWAMPEASLEVYTSANNSGGDGGIDPGPLALSDDATAKAWIPYQSGKMAPIVVGTDTVKFRITPYNVYEVHAKDYPLVFTVEGLENTEYNSTIKLNITEAPVMAFDPEELHIENVASDYKGTSTVNLMNDGKYKLIYSLSLDPSGRDAGNEYEDGNDPAPSYNVISYPSEDVAKNFVATCVEKISGKKGMVKALGLKKVKDDQKFIYDLPSDYEGNALYYPVLNPVANAQAALMGTGASALDENFYAATRYEAPAEGFNLTHLYFVGTVGDLENVDIEASVILGNDVTATEKTIGHGKIHIVKEEPLEDGSYRGAARMLEFDNPIYINPADTFYVVLKYPAGYKSSAMMATKDGDMEPNRYMAHLKSLGGWVDIEALYDNAYSYGAFGFFMTCIEKEKGEPWIKLLNEKKEGEIAPGKAIPVQFEVNAKSAYFAKNNKATLVVKSNDPYNKLYNYHIYLNKNAAPVITAPEGETTVPEDSKAMVPVTVADAEGEAFTVSLNDADGIASVESYENEDGTQDGISESNGTYTVEAGGSLKLNVALAPDYGTAGKHTFTVNAKDESGNVSSAVVNYNVEHTNRAPKYVGPADLALKGGETSAQYYFADFFEDADGDVMTFSAQIADPSLAALYQSENGIIIAAKQVSGSTNINVVATDANGASTTGVIALTVDAATGINNVVADASKGDVTVNGDAENGNLNVTIDADADKVVLSVYSNAGQLMAQKTLQNVHAGDKASVALGKVAAGVYHLVANVDGKTSAVKFVAK